LRKKENFFSIVTARITMEELGISPSGYGAVCFKDIQTSDFEAIKKDIDGLLQIGKRESGTEFEEKRDEFGYLWFTFRDDDFEDLAATINMVEETLRDEGYEKALLCSLIKFEKDKKGIYLIFRKNLFYPFVPLEKRSRDTAYEMKIANLLEKELPMEKRIEEWYPIWGIPF
jgi:hypothetical protein